MIQVYPVSVEAYDEDHHKVFSLDIYDEGSATLKAETMISSASIHEFCEALKYGLNLLRLEP